MGAGAYVGRIGGLAVALGIGAAVFVGQGVASAQPSTTSGSEPSSTSSSESNQPAEKKADASTDSGDTKPAAEPKPKKKKKSTVVSDATETTKTADEPNAAEDSAPTVSAAVVKSKEEPPATPIVKAKDPVAQASVAVSSLVSAGPSPLAGGAPEAPVESPLPWMMMAAARQEFGKTPSLSKVAGPVTTSGAADPVQASTLAAIDVPPTVIAIPQTSLLTPLQHLPVFGPMFVTPVVALIHQIPIIGDVLHPIIGYPIGMTGGSTPRDVKVISADGTAIYVHFFPAQGDALGTRAPTILNGPGLGLPGETNPTLTENPFLANQVIGMAPLLKNGYNVVTWDPRGEWSSGGRLEINHQDFEGQDMKAIISWLSTQPEVALDSPGRSEDRHGRRVIRRRNPVGDCRDRSAGRRHRADGRVEQPQHLAGQERGAQDQLGRAAHRCAAVHGRPGESTHLPRAGQHPADRRGVAVR